MRSFRFYTFNLLFLFKKKKSNDDLNYAFTVAKMLILLMMRSIIKQSK